MITLRTVCKYEKLKMVVKLVEVDVPPSIDGGILLFFQTNENPMRKELLCSLDRPSLLVRR